MSLIANLEKRKLKNNLIYYTINSHSISFECITIISANIFKRNKVSYEINISSEDKIIVIKYKSLSFACDMVEKLNDYIVKYNSIIGFNFPSNITIIPNS